MLVPIDTGTVLGAGLAEAGLADWTERNFIQLSVVFLQSDLCNVARRSEPMCKQLRRCTTYRDLAELFEQGLALELAAADRSSPPAVPKDQAMIFLELLLKPIAEQLVRRELPEFVEETASADSLADANGDGGIFADPSNRHAAPELWSRQLSPSSCGFGLHGTINLVRDALDCHGTDSERKRLQRAVATLHALADASEAKALGSTDKIHGIAVDAAEEAFALIGVCRGDRRTLVMVYAGLAVARAGLTSMPRGADVYGKLYERVRKAIHRYTKSLSGGGLLETSVPAPSGH